ncbi:MAG: outer membrane beta-barrel protein, partial [Chitinophaga rupis]
MLNGALTVPTAFHKGDGVRPYASLLTEYRPNKRWGGMLNVAYDNRGGNFDNVTAPCNCEATLSTNLSYITVEPSLRLAPFSSAFYIFAGPTLSFNIAKSFTYTKQKQTDTRDTWSDIHKVVFSGQAGLGFDFPLSSRTSATQMTLSPFASFLTDFGHDPRGTESWSNYTIRAGIALKFGTSKSPATKKSIPAPLPAAAAAPEKEVQFSVRAPKVPSLNSRVTETFALRNSVFFDMGSSEIPQRYIQLSQPQASTFTEQQVQQGQPEDLNTGRSARQMKVYHNILNILGDRLRANPKSTIQLMGASDKNPE